MAGLTLDLPRFTVLQGDDHLHVSVSHCGGLTHSPNGIAVNLLCDLVSLKQKSRCLSTAHGHCRHHFVETEKPVSTLMHICGSARLWDYFHIISILDSMPSFARLPYLLSRYWVRLFPHIGMDNM